MPVRSLLRVFLAVLWLWPAAAYGQSPALVDASKRFTELYTQGRYQQALPFAEKALRLAEHEFGPDHPPTATALNTLPELYPAHATSPSAEPRGGESRNTAPPSTPRPWRARLSRYAGKVSQAHLMPNLIDSSGIASMRFIIRMFRSRSSGLVGQTRTHTARW